MNYDNLPFSVATFGVARVVVYVTLLLGAFGMGQDNALPRKLFAHIDPKSRVPTYNIWVIGLIAFLGAMFLNWERAAEVLNIGAFLAFMGVNLAAMRHFYLRPCGRDQRQVAKDPLLPALGFLFCLWIWGSLPRPAKIVGGA